jgi:hypothetical protein
LNSASDAFGFSLANAAALTTRSSSCWMDNRNVEAIWLAVAADASCDFAVSARDIERAANAAPTMPAPASSTEMTIHLRRCPGRLGPLGRDCDAITSDEFISSMSTTAPNP